MTVHDDIDFEEATLADSWSRSVTEDLERSRRTAWIVAAVAGAIALLPNLLEDRLGISAIPQLQPTLAAWALRWVAFCTGSSVFTAAI